jgi:hypothetical protein
MRWSDKGLDAETRFFGFGDLVSGKTITLLADLTSSTRRTIGPPSLMQSDS